MCAVFLELVNNDDMFQVSVQLENEHHKWTQFGVFHIKM